VLGRRARHRCHGPDPRDSSREVRREKRRAGSPSREPALLRLPVCAAQENP
jgi:hypothetical protein